MKNGFSYDWMPNGYRDVKVNPVVNGHLCEIQLQLGEFFTLKHGQHAVYKWARELNVATEVEPEYLLENLSGEVMEEMLRLAQRDWHGTGYCLTDLQVAAGQFDEAETGIRQVDSALIDVQLHFLVFAPVCFCVDTAVFQCASALSTVYAP